MGREGQGVAVSRHRYQVIPRTLCFVRHQNQLLLLLGGPHKRIWAGLYNGLGGHVEPGEDIYASVLREVREESGLELQHVTLRGIVHADAGDPAAGILFFVFTGETEQPHTTPSQEGALEWHPVNALPFERMVEDLPTLLPRVLKMGPADPPFFAAYHYDADDRLVIEFAPAPTGSAGTPSRLR